jgi:hypothetical protein
MTVEASRMTTLPQDRNRAIYKAQVAEEDRTIPPSIMAKFIAHCRYLLMLSRHGPFHLAFKFEYPFCILVHYLVDNIILESQVPVVFNRLPHRPERVRATE